MSRLASTLHGLYRPRTHHPLSPTSLLFEFLFWAHTLDTFLYSPLRNIIARWQSKQKDDLWNSRESHTDEGFYQASTSGVILRLTRYLAFEVEAIMWRFMLRTIEVRSLLSLSSLPAHLLTKSSHGLYYVWGCQTENMKYFDVLMHYEQLLRSPTFHKGVHKIHKTIRRQTHGPDLEEMGGTKLEDPRSRCFAGPYESG